MLNAIMVTNNLGESIVLELRSPEKTGLLVQSIEGLGPPHATINYTEIATMDGGIYNSSRSETRNIVLDLKLMDGVGYSVEDSRLLSYRMFPIKRQVTLTFQTDNRIAYIVGYVESNEPNIFSDNENTQISIICPSPWFKSAAYDELLFRGTSPNFEFPFDISTDPEEWVELSIFSDDTSKSVVYYGDMDTGVILTFTITGTPGDIVIYNNLTLDYMTISSSKIEAITDSPIGRGDVIQFNTISGERSLYLFRGDSYYNIIGSIDRSASWPTIHAGTNSFSILGTADSKAIESIMEFPVIYEGI